MDIIIVYLYSPGPQKCLCKLFIYKVTYFTYGKQMREYPGQRFLKMYYAAIEYVIAQIWVYNMFIYFHRLLLLSQEMCVEKVLDFPFSLTNKPRIHRQYNCLSRHTEFLMLRYWHSVYQLTASGRMGSLVMNHRSSYFHPVRLVACMVSNWSLMSSYNCVLLRYSIIVIHNYVLL